jgi:multiple RNA-binding domain-containing protein 1
LKLNFDDETNWNYLFMNQDTVATSMAKKLGVEKSSLLDKNSSNMAVTLAKAETIIINQTKTWMQQQGIDLDLLEKTNRKECKRSRTTLLVKNIPFSTKEKDLRSIFERYGELARLSISPYNTLAIIEYVSAM